MMSNSQNSTPQKKFSPEVRQKCLLWCARHCCLCGKNCGLDIEFHHLQDLEDGLPAEMLNEIDNAMPVCYQCHADLERSKRNSPRGSKYIIEELKARREQVYEEYTRHLVPVIYFGPTNEREFPGVGFHITNTDGSRPVYVKCRVEILVNKQFFGTPIRHYSGEKTWACNPGFDISAWFDLSNGTHLEKSPEYRGPDPSNAHGKEIRLRVHLTIIDVLEREHKRLPTDWFYDPERKTWVFDP